MKVDLLHFKRTGGRHYEKSIEKPTGGFYSDGL